MNDDLSFFSHRKRLGLPFKRPFIYFISFSYKTKKGDNNLTLLEMGSTLKGKNLPLKGADSFLLE